VCNLLSAGSRADTQLVPNMLADTCRTLSSARALGLIGARGHTWHATGDMTHATGDKATTHFRWDADPVLTKGGFQRLVTGKRKLWLRTIRAEGHCFVICTTSIALHTAQSFMYCLAYVRIWLWSVPTLLKHCGVM
jgi:hypothetical protein